MIDLATEELEPLPSATSYFPRRASGRKVHTKTIRRYVLSGLRGHKLDAVRGAGGQLFTSRAAVHRFLAAISADLQVPPDKPNERKDDAQIDLALRARGLMK